MERLSANITTTRSISEIQNGVVSEVQNGFSFQETSSESYNEGGASGGGLVGLLRGASGNYGYGETLGGAI